MKDLRDAIRKVLENADDNNVYRGDNYLIHGDVLRILQSEYNIHFIEPENEQLDTIK